MVFNSQLPEYFMYLRTGPPNKQVRSFGSLLLCGKKRSWQGLSESEKKIGDNRVFFRDHRATIKKR